jgi:hypothetical protein
LKLLENNNPPWYKGLLRQVLILNMVVRFHQGEQSKVVEFDHFKKKSKILELTEVNVGLYR